MGSKTSFLNDNRGYLTSSKETGVVKLPTSNENLKKFCRYNSTRTPGLGVDNFREPAVPWRLNFFSRWFSVWYLCYITIFAPRIVMFFVDILEKKNLNP